MQPLAAPDRQKTQTHARLSMNATQALPSCLVKRTYTVLAVQEHYVLDDGGLFDFDALDEVELAGQTS